MSKGIGELLISWETNSNSDRINNKLRNEENKPNLTGCWTSTENDFHTKDKAND